MNIRKATPNDVEAIARMKRKLWPDADDDLAQETLNIIKNGEPDLLLVADDGELRGFIEVSERRYAEGCKSSPVPYIEGWWVDESFRRQGVGAALVHAVEDICKERGHTELASDTWFDHELSVRAHTALGFDVVETATHFRKALSKAEKTLSKAGKDVEGAYDVWAASYDSDQNKTRDLAHEVMQAALRDFSGSVLDIGCGTGTMLQAVSSNFDTVAGFDVSEEMLAQARKKLPDADLRVADLREAWPTEDGSFDVVYETLVLEHIEDLGHFYQEAARLLRPGGVLLVVEFHPIRQAQNRGAEFELNGKTIQLQSFQHGFADMVSPALAAGLQLMETGEYSSAVDQTPRVLKLVFSA